MPYSNVLKKTIENSNLSYKEIKDKLEQKGIHIDKSYLSKLVNGKLPPPRDEISKAISQICNVDERLLVLEAYYDKSPQEIKDILSYLQKITTMSAIPKLAENTNIDAKQLDLICEKVNQEGIGIFLAEILDWVKNDNYQILDGNLSVNSKKDNIKFQLEEPIFFPITNNDMYPIVPDGCQVNINIQEKYQNGDIVALKYNNTIIARYYFEVNQNITYTAINKTAKTFDNSNKKIKLLGKITKVIYDV